MCSTSPARGRTPPTTPPTSRGRATASRPPARCSTGGTYVNFLTEEEGRDRIEAAYSAADLEKLAALKRKYDPENLFRHTKNVTG